MPNLNREAVSQRLDRRPCLPGLKGDKPFSSPTTPFSSDWLPMKQNQAGKVAQFCFKKKLMSLNTVKLGLYVPGLVRTFGYYVLSVDHGHCQSAFFALSLVWIKRTLFRTYLLSFPLRVRYNRVSLYFVIGNSGRQKCMKNSIHSGC